jgi:glycosyltransferase involved in cell wall biosynthesis
MLKLSIITINYNNREGLEKTMHSVFLQRFTGYEYIIVDGGSLDGSKEMIEQNESSLAWFVSEKDKGIYHAMNKGIEKAKGEYLLFLNSGDILVDDTSLGHFLGFDADIICADLKIIEGNTYQIRYAPDAPTFDFFTRDTLPHQSAFIKKSLFEKAGLYNEDLKFVSDWKFYLDAMCKFNATYVHLKKVVAAFNFDGISSDPENAPILHKERNDILAREYAMFYNDYLNFHECKAALRNYTSSRAHHLTNLIINHSFYKRFKK